MSGSSNQGRRCDGISNQEGIDLQCSELGGSGDSLLGDVREYLRRDGSFNRDARTDSGRSRRTKGFSITVNNPTDRDVLNFQTLVSRGVCQYACFQKEICPTTRTPHLQGYAHFGSPTTFNAAGRLLFSGDGVRRGHFGHSNGSALANIKYCSKTDSRAEDDPLGFQEFGTRPVGQGHRSDLDGICQAIVSGTSINTIVATEPATYVKYRSGLLGLFSHVQGTRSFKTHVSWFFGGTGTGKSAWACAHADQLSLAKQNELSVGSDFPGADFSMRPYWKMGGNRWWDGYSGQYVVIIDDYRCDLCTFSYLLRLFDRYPLLVECKGGSIQFVSYHIIVTAPLSPRDMWAQRSTEDLRQLTRRIDEVRDFNMFPYVVNTSESS